MSNLALKFENRPKLSVVEGGTITAGNQVRIIVKDKGLTGGQLTVSYTIIAADTFATIAAKLAAAVSMNASMQTIGVNATSSGSIITVQSASLNTTAYSTSVSSGATATITATAINNGTQKALIGGTVTASDILTITVIDSGLPGGQKAINYTVQAGDTLNSIATNIASAINADTDLQAISVNATSATSTVSIKSNSSNPTTYTSSVSLGSTETIALSTSTNGIQTAAISGTKTTGNILTITVYDTGLTGGSKAVNYTVVSGGNLSTVATGLANAINADTDLQAIGVSALAANQVVNIKSNSLNKTSYTKSLSGGATVTITLGLNTGIQQYAYNNVNALTNVSAGGLARFDGTTNKAVKSATINSTYPATLNWSKSFTGNAPLTTGLNTTTVAATDGGNNTVTNTYQVQVNTGASSSPTHDANGNMTSDGTNTYAWDAENRLIKITYPGTNNFTDITYDGLGHWAKIVETANAVITATRQFVYSGDQIGDQRNAAGSIVSRYYSLGQRNSSTNYFYFKNHLGSTTEMTNTAGVIQDQRSYDAYGQMTKIQGAQNADFQYAGYYFHTPSGLSLTVNRAYNPTLGRWINRDPIGEMGGLNLYGYVGNQPISKTDLSGLICRTNPFKNPLEPPDQYSPFTDCHKGGDPDCCKDNWEDCSRLCDRLYHTEKDIKLCKVCCQQVFERCKNNSPFSKFNWHDCFPGLLP